MESGRHSSTVDIRALQEALARRNCQIAKVWYGGVQSGFGLRPDMFLFQPTSGPAMGTTLALPFEENYPLAIAEKVRAAESAFRKEAA